MHKVLTASGYFEHVAAYRIRHDLCIIIPKDSRHRHILYAFIHDRILRNDKAAIDKCTLAAHSADLIAFRNLVPLINKPVICCYNEMMCIGIGIDLTNQGNYFPDCLFTCHEHFILRIRFISPGINLIMVNVNYLFPGKNFTEIILLKVFDVIKLNAYRVWHMTL